MVLCFHAGFGWMSGGYVGVSVFFTLSGYLITSLALVDHAAQGRLAVGAFYRRRIRRLLPASACCLSAVSVLATFGAFAHVENLRRDLWAALGQVFNWTALGSGVSYQEQVDAAAGRLAPLDHYWSLAIEEQFYWVWPLVLAAALPRLRTASARLAGIVALTVLAGASAPVIAAVWGPDAAYWATPARLGEILVGATLAVIGHERRQRRIADAPAMRWVAVAGLAVIAVAAVTWPAGRGPAYEGWLPLFAVASAALIAGLQVPSPLRRALGWSPLVALGTISYGVYLYHWPIYALLDPVRVDVPRPLLFAVRVVVTLAVATVSYIVIERPLRVVRTAPRRVAGVALAGTAVVALFAALVVPTGSGRYWLATDDQLAAAAFSPAGSIAAVEATTSTSTVADGDEGDGGTTISPTILAPATAPPTNTPETLPVTAPPTNAPETAPVTAPPLPAGLSRPIRILVMGDSTASAVGTGLLLWAGAHPTFAEVDVRWAPGCGFFRTVPPAVVSEFEDDCVALYDDLASDLGELQPDVVLLMTTPTDLAPRRFDGGSPTAPSDPGFAAALVEAYDGFTRLLQRAGVERVAWVSPPTPERFGDVAVDPVAYETLRASVRKIAADHVGAVHAVDLAAWFEQHPETERPDGLHVSPESSASLAERYLGPLLVSLALP